MLGGNRDLKEVTGKAFCSVETFGLTPDCDWCAGDILWHDDATEFRVTYRGSEVARIRIPGRQHTTFSMRSPPPLSPMGEALNARPLRKLSPHFKACGAAWKSRAKRMACLWLRISPTIQQRFGSRWRPLVLAGRLGEFGQRLSLDRTPCAASFSRTLCQTRSPLQMAFSLAPLTGRSYFPMKIVSLPKQSRRPLRERGRMDGNGFCFQCGNRGLSGECSQIR